MAGSGWTDALNMICKQHVPIKLCLKGRERSPEGFVAAVGEKLMIFAELYDFIPMGYLVYSIDQIEELDELTGFYEGIVEQEHLYESFGKIPQVCLNGWKRVMEDLMEQDRIFGIELTDESYCPGKIERLAERTVKLRCFSPEGEWDDMPLSIRHSQIGNLKLGDPYTEMFVKYLPELPENFRKTKECDTLLASIEID